MKDEFQFLTEQPPPPPAHDFSVSNWVEPVLVAMIGLAILCNAIRFYASLLRKVFGLLVRSGGKRHAAARPPASSNIRNF